MTRTSRRAAAAPSEAETATVAMQPDRRPELPQDSARAAAKASMAAGFPAPPQLAAQLGEAEIAAIEAELKAEAGPPPAPETATVQTQEG